ncbi:MAG TPA: glycoside hydrolase family 76 protein [Chthoniobacter sp.]
MARIPRVLFALIAPVFVLHAADEPPAGKSPSPGDSHPLAMRDAAALAVQDLLDHWWIGDASTGHLQPTHGGCAVGKGRGVIWERTTVICALEPLASAGDAKARERICAQWHFDKSQYTMKELQACGPGSGAPWCDDAAWQVMYYVIAFEQSGDGDALAAAKGLLENIHTRWFDEQLGGGLWYNDRRQVKSLYAVAYIYGALGVYGATGDSHYLDLALAEYQWIETHLLRADHLYWCDYSAGPPANPEHHAGPVGAERPNSIHTAGSVSYLGGNLGMAACQARLYELTGQDSWREAALRTTAAIHERLCDGTGCFINDRDAFTNGFFIGAWAQRLNGFPGSEPAFENLRRTAQVIAQRRTGADYRPLYGPSGAGFYPGDWDGGNKWESHESLGSMIHVSATSVSFLTAAAALDR